MASYASGCFWGYQNLGFYPLFKGREDPEDFHAHWMNNGFSVITHNQNDNGSHQLRKEYI